MATPVGASDLFPCSPRSPPLAWALLAPLGTHRPHGPEEDGPPWSSPASLSFFAEVTAQRGSSLTPGLLIQCPAAPSPMTISHNSHERGLIYGQEIQTLDITSKGLFICMKKGASQNIHFSSPLGFEDRSPRPCPTNRLDDNQRILWAEGGRIPGYPMLAAGTPSLPCKGSDLGVYLLLKTQSLALNPLLFFGSCLKPLPQPSFSDHLCRKVSSLGPG